MIVALTTTDFFLKNIMSVHLFHNFPNLILIENFSAFGFKYRYCLLRQKKKDWNVDIYIYTARSILKEIPGKMCLFIIH